MLRDDENLLFKRIKIGTISVDDIDECHVFQGFCELRLRCTNTLDNKDCKTGQFKTLWRSF